MSKIRGNGGELSSVFEGTMRDVTDKAESAMEEVKETLADVGGRIGGMVREHPVASVLAGVGLGFLVGRILSGR